MAFLTTFYDHAAEIAVQEGISLLEAMREVRALGIEGLEIALHKIVGRERTLERYLTDAGLSISSIPVYLDFARPNVLSQGGTALGTARRFGVRRLLVIPGFYRAGSTPEERTREDRRIAGWMDKLAEQAEAAGVELMMEDYDNSLSPVATAGSLRFFLDACPAVSCCFDTGNFRFSGEDVNRAYTLLKDRIAYVHLKDRAYTPEYGGQAVTAADGQALYPCPVGSGGLDLAGTVRALRQGGYDGPYALEHYGAPAMLDYLKRSAAWAGEQLAD